MNKFYTVSQVAIVVAMVIVGNACAMERDLSQKGVGTPAQKIIIDTNRNIAKFSYEFSSQHVKMDTHDASYKIFIRDAVTIADNKKKSYTQSLR